MVITIAILANIGCESRKYDVNSIEITPNKSILQSANVQQFECQAMFADGIKRPFNPAWNISDSKYGTISNSGLFEAAAGVSGECEIIATYKDLTAKSVITIINTNSAIIEPLSAPDNLIISDISSNSLSLNWSKVTAEGYLLSYGTDNNAENLGTKEIASESLAINGLKSDLLYYFKICAYKTVNNTKTFSPFSQIKSAKTSKYPAKFSINGNKILDDKGIEVVFRGVNILDPAWMDSIYKNLNDGYFNEISNWKAKIIRIPIHPTAYRFYGKSNYLNILDRAVESAAKNKIYCVLVFHSIGFPPEETYENLAANGAPWTDPIYKYNNSELIEFWKDVANHYNKNDDRIAFYEIFNEPTMNKANNGSNSWLEWKQKAEELVDIIRNIDDDAKIIVNGLDYGYDLSFVKNNPLNRQNIVYGTHPYPNKQKSWDDAFGSIKENYPVFATEFGFDPNTKENYKADEKYGNDLINYLESKKISWTAWSFSTDWYPNLLTDWTYNTSISGKLFKDYLINLNK